MHTAMHKQHCFPVLDCLMSGALVIELSIVSELNHPGECDQMRRLAEGAAGFLMRCVPAQIDIEDFRVVTESYGMQLNDDSILAIFSKVYANELRHARLVVLMPAFTFLHLLQAFPRASYTSSVLLTAFLCAQYDAEGAGKIQYKDLMKELLELEQLALYALHES